MSLTNKFICSAIYFIILYFVAYASNRGYEDDEDVLGISKTQWRAILVMWIPMAVAIFK